MRLSRKKVFAPGVMGLSYRLFPIDVIDFAEKTGPETKLYSQSKPFETYAQVGSPPVSNENRPYKFTALQTVQKNTNGFRRVLD